MRTTVLVSVCLLGGCTEKLETWHCTSNADCQSKVCAPDGNCVPDVEPLTFVTTSLKPAAVGDTEYSEQVVVQGGVPEYHFTLSILSGAGNLSWLRISESGELLPKDGQAPAKVASGLSIEIGATDRSNAGAGQTIKRTFAFAIQECVEDMPCTQAVSGRCEVGVRRCTGGQLGPDCLDPKPSTDRTRCGAACAECPAQADSCAAGLCRCGGSDPCEVSKTCCAGSCVDLQGDLHDCGACGIDCVNLPNTASQRCEAGMCKFDCTSGYHNCSAAGPGCETVASLENCSACGDACDNTNVYLHTTAQDCTGGTCSFACAAGFGDCDGKRENGCEADLKEPDHCGACGVSCSAAPAGHACLTGGATPVCGCNDSRDCAGNQMCCGDQCVDRTSEHCLACDTPCSIVSGGTDCANTNGAWSCQCTDKKHCNAGYDFSAATCSAAKTCICSSPTDKICSGATDDMCCLNNDATKACVDLTDSEEHCGMCGKSCATGQSCQSGACSCVFPTSPCPLASGNPDCVNGNCVCSFAGNKPCPPGQRCCEYEGCCLSECGADNFEIFCSKNCPSQKGVWCACGCCPSSDCKTEADCAKYCAK